MSRAAGSASPAPTAEPSLMLLDEPTASLDDRDEQALKDAIDVAAAADRTLLIMAHRLPTVVDTDQIVVLDEGRVVAIDEGRVVATGTHAQLLPHSPLHAEPARSRPLVRPRVTGPPRGRGRRRRVRCPRARWCARSRARRGGRAG